MQCFLIFRARIWKWIFCHTNEHNAIRSWRHNDSK